MRATDAPPMIPLPQLAQMAGGDLLVREVPKHPSAREAFLREGVEGASIDSRTIRPGELFVPLAGRNTDGHRFLEEAFTRGAAAALCDRLAYPAWRGREPGPLVLVEDVTAALQRLANRHRRSWQGLLLAVTGSSGKTTTKNLVAAVLETRAPVLKTEGNRNNHWGVPLTLLALRAEHQAAVVELAMSGAGEIAALAAIAGPQAGLITNVGRAHLGGPGLGSAAAIAREKAALGFALAPGEPLFVGDGPLLRAALGKARCRVIRFGFSRAAEVRPSRIEDLGPDGSRFEVEGFPPIHLRLIGRHQVMNALAALAVAREVRLDPEAVTAALAAARPVAGRMEVRTLRGAVLLVDYYNANPESTRAALGTLAGWPGRRRIAVLGEMLELGTQAARLHREVGAAVRGAELWAVGPHAPDTAAGAKRAGLRVRVFADKAALAVALEAALEPGTVVLLKASRGAALEDVLAPIQEA
ncbi:MAG: UDP-N-acetylmuramoyl-tripeptide--D-alanyl-D-alanine ligase [Candidatus Eisenbacteria bacterium]|uniref:UDP-N-acetylmuramoyl-tripeptide--D-alanyl-D-alanine ligase n=1 Tax=Eiseniibacteriota bacterium TaxID=2212470 RepID=A0A538TV72_UNCEI|nr:MAG: UDP-N-acetylmuramoyl-tripeptide--D-alanyl-D-alanine ligase [Candidatus Eisenbacteria bacterium]